MKFAAKQNADKLGPCVDRLLLVRNTLIELDIIEFS